MESDKRIQAGLNAETKRSVCVLTFSGDWRLGDSRQEVGAFLAETYQNQPFTQLQFATDDLGEWDMSLLVFIREACRWADELSIAIELGELPEGVQNLMKLSRAVPELKQSSSEDTSSFFASVGDSALSAYRGFDSYLQFLGQLVIDLLICLRGKAQIRWRDLFFLLQATGPKALLIVSLLSFLMGLIIAFIGVIQLQKFGADIYVADLVGLAVTRELGAVMVGIIMAGRTGAAFAAQIGSMQVNEEIDALVCFGISPMQFLVIPRVIALVLMMPLLCVCADFVGIMGGMIVAVSLSDVNFTQYMNQIEYAVAVNDFLGGVFKSAVFGVIIAIAGCYRGLNCGRDATAVGQSTTSAVVTSITWIVIADAIFAVVFNIFGI